MHYETAVAIDASPAAVWQAMADVADWPAWNPSVRAVAPLDGAELAVGRRFRISQPGLPRLVWEVTRVEAGRRFTWQARLPGVRTVGDHEMLPDGTGVRVTLRIAHSGPLAWLAAVQAGRTRRYVDGEARALRTRCERS